MPEKKASMKENLEKVLSGNKRNVQILQQIQSGTIPADKAKESLEVLEKTYSAVVENYNQVQVPESSPMYPRFQKVKSETTRIYGIIQKLRKKY